MPSEKVPEKVPSGLLCAVKEVKGSAELVQRCSEAPTRPLNSGDAAAAAVTGGRSGSSCGLRDLNARISVACIEFDKRRAYFYARPLLDKHLCHDAAHVRTDENRFACWFHNADARNAIGEGNRRWSDRRGPCLWRRVETSDCEAGERESAKCEDGKSDEAEFHAWTPEAKSG